MLRELRAQVSAVVSEVRETLYDLRTELTEDKDLGATPRTTTSHESSCAAGIEAPQVTIEGRLPLLHEREVWQIVREAITNVERHSQAKHLHVVVARDRRPHHGCGARRWCRHRADTGAARLIRDDRDARTGGQHRRHLSARRHESGGTEIRVDMQMGEGIAAVGLTVMLVDDHTMLRQGLRRALEGEGITVIAEAGDGASAVKIALDTHPDVVLMDVSMPTVDGDRGHPAADGRRRPPAGGDADDARRSRRDRPEHQGRVRSATSRRSRIASFFGR